MPKPFVVRDKSVEYSKGSTVPRSPSPRIALAVAGGAWLPKAALKALARRAVAAAVAVHEAETEGAQRVSPRPGPPPQGGMAWSGAELSLLFTDDEAMRALNARWRGIDRPTNVLSFPALGAPGLSPLPGPPRQGGRESVPLGDIVLAAETVAREAALAEKPIADHIGHLIVHGFFHLLGYDHQNDEEAEVMEAMERAALSRIGVPDPFAGSP